MKRFSDLPPEKREVWAEKVKISEVVGVEIVITGFTIITSKYGKDEEATRIEFQRTVQSISVTQVPHFYGDSLKRQQTSFRSSRLSLKRIIG